MAVILGKDVTFNTNDTLLAHSGEVHTGESGAVMKRLVVMP
jgi:hypothetical protein